MWIVFRVRLMTADDCIWEVARRGHPQGEETGSWAVKFCACGVPWVSVLVTGVAWGLFVFSVCFDPVEIPSSCQKNSVTFLDVSLYACSFSCMHVKTLKPFGKINKALKERKRPLNSSLHLIPDAFTKFHSPGLGDNQQGPQEVSYRPIKYIARPLVLVLMRLHHPRNQFS